MDIQKILKSSLHLLFSKSLSKEDTIYFGTRLIGTEFDDFENNLEIILFDDDKFLSFLEDKHYIEYIFNPCLATNIVKFCKAVVRDQARRIVFDYLELINYNPTKEYMNGVFENMTKDLIIISDIINKKDFKKELEETLKNQKKLDMLDELLIGKL